MPDYKSMYYRLFNRVSDAITALQSAQQESEQAMMNSKDDPILFPIDEQNFDEFD